MTKITGLENAINALKDPNTEIPDQLKTGAEFHPEAYHTDNSEDDGESDSIHNASEHEKQENRGKVNIEQTPQAPEFIRGIYQEISPDVKRLLQSPEDKESVENLSKGRDRILKYYDDNGGARGEIQFGIDVGFLCRTAREGAAYWQTLLEDPGDSLTRQNYETLALTLEEHGNLHSWPKDWRLEGLPPTIWDASEHIETLKKNPDDAEAIDEIEKIRKRIEEYMNNNPDEMRTEVTEIQLDALRAKYRDANKWFARLMDDPTDHNARKMADQTLVELDSFIAKNKYPRFWVVNKPSGAGSSMPAFPGASDVPTTRDGYPIYGYRTCGYGYLFAVRTDPNSPIGELWPGRSVGGDAKKAYFNSNAVNMTRKYQKGDEERFTVQQLQHVFVHPGPRHETWVMALFADKISETREHQNSLMTRSDYCKIRKGIDGNYDISEFYQKHRQEVPDHIVRALQPKGRTRAKENTKPGENLHLEAYNTGGRPLLESTGNTRTRQHQENEINSIWEHIRELQQQQRGNRASEGRQLPPTSGPSQAVKNKIVDPSPDIGSVEPLQQQLVTQLVKRLLQ